MAGSLQLGRSGDYNLGRCGGGGGGGGGDSLPSALGSYVPSFHWPFHHMLHATRHLPVPRAMQAKRHAHAPSSALATCMAGVPHPPSPQAQLAHPHLPPRTVLLQEGGPMGASQLPPPAAPGSTRPWTTHTRTRTSAKRRPLPAQRSGPRPGPSCQALHRAPARLPAYMAWGPLPASGTAPKGATPPHHRAKRGTLPHTPPPDFVTPPFRLKTGNAKPEVQPMATRAAALAPYAAWPRARSPPPRTRSIRHAAAGWARACNCMPAWLAGGRRPWYGEQGSAGGGGHARWCAQQRAS